MPAETLVIWFFGPIPGPLSSALAKPKRHNPDILSFGLSVRGIFVQVPWHFLLERPGFSG
jgi:hypothetical protein